MAESSALGSALGLGNEAQLRPHHFRTASILSEAIYQDDGLDAKLNGEHVRLLRHEKFEPGAGKFLTVLAAEMDEESGGKTVYIVWKGSEGAADFFADAAVTPLAYGDSRTLSVHSGIFSLLSQDVVKHGEIVRDILSGLGDDSRLIFSGHSLGGGVAALALLRALAPRTQDADIASLCAHHASRMFAITFAAPMVMCTKLGAQEEHRKLLELVRQRHYNFVYGNDLVPRMPHHVEYLKDHICSLTQVAKSATSMIGNRFLSLVDGKVAGAYQAGTWIFGRLLESLVAAGVDACLSKLSPVLEVCKMYRCHSTVISLDPFGAVRRMDMIPQYSEELEALDGPGTLLKHHLISNYVEAIEASVHPGAGLDQDSANKVAILTFPRAPGLANALLAMLGWRCPYEVVADPTGTIELILGVEMRTLSRLQAACSPQRPACVISFSGGSRKGKSYIIKELLGPGAVQFPHTVPSQPGEERSTTGDVQLFKGGAGQATEHCWFMDCEGTGGTDPVCMSDQWKGMLTSVAAHFPGNRRITRHGAVKRLLPPLALLTSKVFCHVVRVGPSTLEACTEVLELAKQAWQPISNTSRPALIVIQNRTPPAEDHGDFRESTKKFLDVASAAGHDLQHYFSEVHFVQLGENNPDEALKQADSTWIGKDVIFRRQVEQLHSLLGTVAGNTVEKALACGQHLTERAWFQLFPQVVASVNSEEFEDPICILSKRLHDTGLFLDVLHMAGDVFSPKSLQQNNVKHFWQLYDYVEGLVEQLKLFAARSLVLTLIEVGMLLPVRSAEFWSSPVGVALTSFTQELYELLPCCAEKHGELCGMQKGGHERHRSMYGSISWEGRHSSDGISDMPEDFADQVYLEACRLWPLAQAEGWQPNMQRIWFESTLCTKCRPLNKRCFYCCQNLTGSVSWWQRMAHLMSLSRKKVAHCNSCRPPKATRSCLMLGRAVA